jgi:hypothetical protein
MSNIIFSLNFQYHHLLKLAKCELLRKRFKISLTPAAFPVRSTINLLELIPKLLQLLITLQMILSLTLIRILIIILVKFRVFLYLTHYLFMILLIHVIPTI